jgi:hypothetical protein
MNENLPDPQAGGRYERNADGSLKQIHKTEPAVPRAQRGTAQPTNPEPAGTGDADHAEE